MLIVFFIVNIYFKGAKLIFRLWLSIINVIFKIIILRAWVYLKLLIQWRNVQSNVSIVLVQGESMCFWFPCCIEQEICPGDTFGRGLAEVTDSWIANVRYCTFFIVWQYHGYIPMEQDRRMHFLWNLSSVPKWEFLNLHHIKEYSHVSCLGDMPYPRTINSQGLTTTVDNCQHSNTTV